MSPGVQKLELVERDPYDLPAEIGTVDLVRQIHRVARQRIRIEAPNALDRNAWRLVSEGWIGQLPVSESLVLVIRPKVPVQNLFRMIEVAYQLPGLEFPEGPGVSSAEIADLFERLASILARRILLRLRRGLHREYVRYEDELRYVRGRILTEDWVRRGLQMEVRCRYEDQTADISDNQIVHWTLRKIARTGLARQDTRFLIKQAIRGLSGEIQLKPFTGSDCLRRVYQRLNADYEPLHGLCRFFLEALGPTHETGGATMVPFLVDMDRLFEMFVAKWLEARLPREFTLGVQERIDVDREGSMFAHADLLIRESSTHRALAVLDTKYKLSDAPRPEDLYQINAYADLVGAPRGILVYPAAGTRAFSARLGSTEVERVGFDLSGDLDRAGEAFLARILQSLRTH